MMTTDTAVLSAQPAESQQWAKPVLDGAVQEMQELSELLRLIDSLPVEYRTDLYKVLDRIATGFERRQRVLGYVQESLCQMNLDLKYLVFDLEATRRERDAYRRRLER